MTVSFYLLGEKLVPTFTSTGMVYFIVVSCKLLEVINFRSNIDSRHASLFFVFVAVRAFYFSLLHVFSLLRSVWALADPTLLGLAR